MLHLICDRNFENHFQLQMVPISQGLLLCFTVAKPVCIISVSVARARAAQFV